MLMKESAGHQLKEEKSFTDGKVYLPHKGFLGYKYDKNMNIIMIRILNGL